MFHPEMSARLAREHDGARRRSVAAVRAPRTLRQRAAAVVRAVPGTAAARAGGAPRVRALG